MFLQETHSTKKHENLWKYQWHGDIIFSHKEGRYIILHIEIQGTPSILINYYGPNGENDQVKVLKQLANHLRNINADQIITCILGGDWNLIFDKSLDHKNTIP